MPTTPSDERDSVSLSTSTQIKTDTNIPTALSEKDLVSHRLFELQSRLENEYKMGNNIWSKAGSYIDRLDTPDELPNDLKDAQDFLARHNA